MAFSPSIPLLQPFFVFLLFILLSRENEAYATIVCVSDFLHAVPGTPFSQFQQSFAKGSKTQM